MKFSTKLFLTIFVTSTLSIIIACVLVFNILTNYRKQEFEKSYIDHIELMGVALHRIETSGGKNPTKILEDLVALDDDNKEVELLSPNSDETRKDGAYWDGSVLTILVTSKAGRLKGTISTESLDKQVRHLQVLLSTLSLILATISLFLARILTNVLVRKIRSIESVVAQITEKQDYSQRIIVDPNSDSEIDRLGGQFNIMLEALQQNRESLIAATRDKAKAELAAQVAHDIRSPLTSISLVINEIEKSSPNDATSLLKNAVTRISGIVQKISRVNMDLAPNQIETPRLTLLFPLIESVVNEYQIRLSGSKKIDLKCSNKNIWCVLQIFEIQTAIANMIHNAFEATATTVSIQIAEDDKRIKIQIKDNGSGIPKDLANKIFDRHFTHGKSTGTGLGLDQARKAIEWSGGKVSVESTLDQGSTFLIDLPKEKAPSFVATSLLADRQQRIYFVDDDSTILQTWKNKTEKLENEILFFDSLDNFMKETPPEQSLLIIDSNLGNSLKGIDIIKTLKLTNQAFLCTSDYDDPQIQEQVKKLKAKLIPKPMIADFIIGNN